MIIKFMFSKDVHNTKEVFHFIKEFNSDLGILFDDSKRNVIKLFESEEMRMNIKSFKIPNLINKITYRYFRKSKAKRSFEYAMLLLEKGIATPQPIGYLENYDRIGLRDSYYVSEHLQCDFTFREFLKLLDYPEHENILRQFTRFSYSLHQKGIEFKDHSPGNTLIKKNAEGHYDFFLVDLNRMKFHESMSFEMRMKNLCRLTPIKEMISIMSNEYAKLSGEAESLIFEKLWGYTSDFQAKYWRKKRLKKRFKIQK